MSEDSRLLLAVFFFTSLHHMEASELVTVTFKDTKNPFSSKYLTVAPTPRVETSRQFTSAFPTEGVRLVL